MNTTNIRENSTKETEARLLSGIEAARYCGVSKKFISTHTADRRFPGVVRVGRLVHYDRHIIDRRIANGTLLLDKEEKICNK